MFAKLAKAAALFGAALSVATSAAVLVPSSAQAADQTLTVNCPSNGTGANINVDPGSHNVINVTNCGTLSYPYHGEYFTEDVTTVTGDTTLHLNAPTTSTYISFWADNGNQIAFHVSAVRPNPAGVLNSTTTLEIDSTYGPNFNVTRNDDGSGHTKLGQQDACAITIGAHPYKVQPITISKSGNYTFRTTSAVSALPGYGMSDTPAEHLGLAIYQSFQSGTPETGLLGCGMAFGSGDKSATDLSVTGQSLSLNLTQFSKTLQPGNYDLVVFTKENFDASGWTLGAQTASIELWGASNSVTLGSSLANTGGNLDLLYVGLGLLVVGVSARRLGKN
jgi:hypothetical protein